MTKKIEGEGNSSGGERTSAVRLLLDAAEQARIAGDERGAWRNYGLVMILQNEHAASLEQREALLSRFEEFVERIYTLLPTEPASSSESPPQSRRTTPNE